MRTLDLSSTLGISLALSIALPVKAMAIPQIQDIGTLGGSTCSCGGMSSNGSVLIGISAEAGDRANHLFQWRSDLGMIPLSELAGPGGWAYGSNIDGTIIVGGMPLYDRSQAAFKWTPQNGTNVLPGFGGGNDYAMATSDSGAVIVGSCLASSGDHSIATRWDQYGRQTALTPNGINGSANCVSGDGEVIAGWLQTDSSSSAVFRWTPTSELELLSGVGPGRQAFPSAISKDGSTIVGAANSGPDGRRLAFRWDQYTGMLQLPTLPNMVGSSATVTNANGWVIAGSYNSSDGSLGGTFLWTPRLGIVDLKQYLDSLGVDTSDWFFESCMGISSDGSRIAVSAFRMGALSQSRTLWITGLSLCVSPCIRNAACIADIANDLFPADGVVDGSDFVTFINSFALGDPIVDPSADVAGAGEDGLSPDGIIDGTDFVAFVNSFALGC